ncbi:MULTISPECIES: excalibur calcium-binding domain-containing protein [unclassified Shewanella]|uniref:excalibur calcium-binding domain-containing protein n=1 Tax=unclassified Shewanella TaxID=196818 RepID=UPI002449C529|nr:MULTISPECIES: excalibur calcium-binding domain-containing protein [unclassified Shewanella]MDH0450119.1 excalibur calcium-binding domain-containing protein [Shewanella sp. GD04112]MDH1471808.1 excalibur calcium-binding domain-containing protein [Shewanella sp. GD03713]
MERGILVRWNDEKGFGFIQPEQQGKDVFIHITVLKHMARKPQVGDSILYRTEVQNDGKVKAIKASIEGVAVLANTSKSPRRNSNPPSRSLSNTLLPLLLIFGIGIFGFKKYTEFEIAQSPNNTEIETTPLYEPQTQPLSAPKTQFRCEAGKTHCSQMSSCAEATFYINNCPNTQMDGDGDGIPCERQWCSQSLF